MSPSNSFRCCCFKENRRDMPYTELSSTNSDLDINTISQSPLDKAKSESSFLICTMDASLLPASQKLSCLHQKEHANWGGVREMVAELFPVNSCSAKPAYPPQRRSLHRMSPQDQSWFCAPYLNCCMSFIYFFGLEKGKAGNNFYSQVCERSLDVVGGLWRQSQLVFISSRWQTN